MSALAPDIETTLLIQAPDELSAATVPEFRKQWLAAIQPEHTQLDIDLKRTTFLDSSGLGALIALHKVVAARSGSARLLNPRAPVLQVLELTRMHRTFQIKQS
jgi:anti-sigma B factor antagonist